MVLHVSNRSVAMTALLHRYGRTPTSHKMTSSCRRPFPPLTFAGATDGTVSTKKGQVHVVRAVTNMPSYTYDKITTQSSKSHSVFNRTRFFFTEVKK